MLRDRAAAEAAFDVPTRRCIGTHMADTLAALHAVDVDAVGLGDLGRRNGYIERQLRRWSGQYEQMAVAGFDHGGLVEEVGAALAASVPEQRGTSIVHGDYRLDNVVLDGNGAVAAVLDWEICTLGDPMADVGLLMVYWVCDDGGEPLLGVSSPTSAPGFAPREEVLDRYAATSGRDVSDVGYYMAFGYWKLACILQGVYARYVGRGGGRGPRAASRSSPRRSPAWPAPRRTPWRLGDPARRRVPSRLRGPPDPDPLGPVLVVAMEGWVDAGLGAAAAVTALLADPPSDPVVTFDGDHFLDQRARRPDRPHRRRGHHRARPGPASRCATAMTRPGPTCSSWWGPSRTSTGASSSTAWSSSPSGGASAWWWGSGPSRRPPRTPAR